MSATKPHFKLTVIANRPVSVPIARRETPVEAARRRFGRLFAHEPGSTWRPQPELFLTKWLASRPKKDQA